MQHPKRTIDVPKEALSGCHPAKSASFTACCCGLRSPLSPVRPAGNKVSTVIVTSFAPPAIDGVHQA